MTFSKENAGWNVMILTQTGMSLTGSFVDGPLNIEHMCCATVFITVFNCLRQQPRVWSIPKFHATSCRLRKNIYIYTIVTVKWLHLLKPPKRLSLRISGATSVCNLPRLILGRPLFEDPPKVRSGPQTRPCCYQTVKPFSFRDESWSGAKDHCPNLGLNSKTVSLDSCSFGYGVR